MDGFIEIVPGLWYEEATGLPWSTKRGRWGTDAPLKKLTCKNRDGYYQVRYKGIWSRWHRVVFLHFNGYLPEEVDHQNGIDDNRIEFLRPATRTQQCTYTSSRKGSSSQYLGVSWKKATNKWLARITINGKLKHLGYYTDEKDAARAYDHAAIEHFGEFASPNFQE